MLFRPDERRLAAAVSSIAHDNPFSPERVESEQVALGGEYVADGGQQFNRERPNVLRLRELTWDTALLVRGRLEEARSSLTPEEAGLYEDLCLYALFARYELSLYELVIDESEEPRKATFYAAFERDFNRLLPRSVAFPSGLGAAEALAFFFQLRRAFHYVFRYLSGISRPIAQLRAETWHSVFTHDLRRYRSGLHRHMVDIPTLIVGPTGTGKDLVAQAIAYSQYLPFDASTQKFVAAFSTQYHPLNVSALSRGLVESELFGHRRGAFTGALDAHRGWLEQCGPHGSVFLDELGEIEPDLQVKFLRVLQSRSFQRLGETRSRPFAGKLIAATNRDLDRGLQEGWLREDLYYRLCADRIQTPSLRERIEADPSELALMVGVLSERIVGSDIGPLVASDVLRWIERELDPTYAWPGNVRELEQCVRNVLVRGRYRPPQRLPEPDALDRALEKSGLTSEALLDRYAALVYAQTSSYVETGRRLGLDRRTVKERVARGQLPA